MIMCFRLDMIPLFLLRCFSTLNSLLFEKFKMHIREFIVYVFMVYYFYIVMFYLAVVFHIYGFYPLLF